MNVSILTTDPSEVSALAIAEALEARGYYVAAVTVRQSDTGEIHDHWEGE
jgi:hypothetical protein